MSSEQADQVAKAFTGSENEVMEACCKAAFDRGCTYGQLTSSGVKIAESQLKTEVERLTNSNIRLQAEKLDQEVMERNNNKLRKQNESLAATVDTLTREGMALRKQLNTMRLEVSASEGALTKWPSSIWLERLVRCGLRRYQDANGTVLDFGVASLAGDYAPRAQAETQPLQPAEAPKPPPEDTPSPEEMLLWSAAQTHGVEGAELTDEGALL